LKIADRVVVPQPRSLLAVQTSRPSSTFQQLSAGARGAGPAGQVGAVEQRAVADFRDPQVAEEEPPPPGTSDCRGDVAVGRSVSTIWLSMPAGR
jgi:hypothetical protein